MTWCIFTCSFTRISNLGLYSYYHMQKICVTSASWPLHLAEHLGKEMDTEYSLLLLSLTSIILSSRLHKCTRHSSNYEQWHSHIQHTKWINSRVSKIHFSVIYTHELCQVIQAYEVTQANPDTIHISHEGKCYVRRVVMFRTREQLYARPSNE